jgi:hypothetical protein
MILKGIISKEKQAEYINLLRDDENYYGEFGKQFMSNSNIKTLLENPIDFGKGIDETSALIQGRYFHTMMLEPLKLENFDFVDVTSRNAKIYKEAVKDNGGNMLLLKQEVDNLNLLGKILLENNDCKCFIKPVLYDYEEPGLKEINGMWFKGKADILNHDDKLIVDLKTTSNIQNFRSSAYKYGYDSQAYIYREMFGYNMLYIAVDKNTHQLGIFECSDEFYASGEAKVLEAIDIYNDLWVPGSEQKRDQYYLQDIL